jgi:hypothetical protein
VHRRRHDRRRSDIYVQRRAGARRSTALIRSVAGHGGHRLRDGHLLPGGHDHRHDVLELGNDHATEHVDTVVNDDDDDNNADAGTDDHGDVVDDPDHSDDARRQRQRLGLEHDDEQHDEDFEHDPEDNRLAAGPADGARSHREGVVVGHLVVPGRGFRQRPDTVLDAAVVELDIVVVVAVREGCAVGE